MLPIVIVDDSHVDIALATRVLFQCGIKNPVATFLDGWEALEFVAARGDYKNRVAPFLLLLDLAMNPVSGLELLAKFKKAAESSEELKRSVVVMISGVLDLFLVNEGYHLGATTFLTKPLSCEDVMQMTTAVKQLKIERVDGGYEITLR